MDNIIKYFPHRLRCKSCSNITGYDRYCTKCAHCCDRVGLNCIPIQEPNPMYKGKNEISIYK